MGRAPPSTALSRLSSTASSVQTEAFAGGFRPQAGTGSERGRQETRALTLLSTISLSIPRGPRVVATTLATLMQALMLDSSWGIPCEVSVPSRRRTTVGCCDRMTRVERASEAGTRSCQRDGVQLSRAKKTAGEGRATATCPASWHGGVVGKGYHHRR